MKKTVYVALIAALVGLTACGNQRKKVADAVQQAATTVEQGVTSAAGTAVAAATAAVQGAKAVVSGDSVKARFQGSDGITKKVYWVDAVFYTEAMRAKIKVDDKTYNLEQYPTADGFGYRNAEVDLRGKGDEADLTYTDKNIRALKLKAVN